MGNTTTSFDWKRFKEETVKGKLVWYGGYTQPPKDKPECGFEESCEGVDWELTIIMCSLVGVILLAWIAFKAYRIQKYEQDISSKTSVLKFKDLKTTNHYLVNAPLSDVIMEKGKLNKNTGCLLYTSPSPRDS